MEKIVSKNNNISSKLHFWLLKSNKLIENKAKKIKQLFNQIKIK